MDNKTFIYSLASGIIAVVNRCWDRHSTVYGNSPMTHPGHMPGRLIVTILLCALASTTLYARGGSREDRMDRIDPNEQRDFDRAQRRAAEEKVKEFSGRQSRETKEEQNSAKDMTDAEKRAAKDAEDAAKDAADAAKEAAKEAEDAAKEAAEAAEEAAKEAAEAAEEAAEAAAEAAEENRGSSDSMRDLASSESPSGPARIPCPPGRNCRARLARCDHCERAGKRFCSH